MSRVFDHPNLSDDWECPICNLGTDAPVVLVPIPGTEEGNITKAQQIHETCGRVVAQALIEAHCLNDR